MDEEKLPLPESCDICKGKRRLHTESEALVHQDAHIQDLERRVALLEAVLSER